MASQSLIQVLFLVLCSLPPVSQARAVAQVASNGDANAGPPGLNIPQTYGLGSITVPTFTATNSSSTVQITNAAGTNTQTYGATLVDTLPSTVTAPSVPVPVVPEQASTTSSTSTKNIIPPSTDLPYVPQPASSVPEGSMSILPVSTNNPYSAPNSLPPPGPYQSVPKSLNQSPNPYSPPFPTFQPSDTPQPTTTYSSIAVITPVTGSTPSNGPYVPASSNTAQPASSIYTSQPQNTSSNSFPYQPSAANATSTKPPYMPTGRPYPYAPNGTLPSAPYGTNGSSNGSSKTYSLGAQVVQSSDITFKPLPGCHNCAGVQEVDPTDFGPLETNGGKSLGQFSDGLPKQLPVQTEAVVPFTTAQPAPAQTSNPIVNPQRPVPHINLPVGQSPSQPAPVAAPAPPPAPTEDGIMSINSVNNAPDPAAAAQQANPVPAPAPVPASPPPPSGALGLGSQQQANPAQAPNPQPVQAANNPNVPAPAVPAPQAAQANDPAPNNPVVPPQAPAPASAPANDNAGPASNVGALGLAPIPAAAPAPAAQPIAAPPVAQPIAQNPAPAAVQPQPQPQPPAQAAVQPAIPQANPATPNAPAPQGDTQAGPANIGSVANPALPNVPAPQGNSQAGPANIGSVANPAIPNVPAPQGNTQAGLANIGSAVNPAPVAANDANPPPAAANGAVNAAAPAPAQQPPQAVIPLGPSSSAIAVQAPANVGGQNQPNAVLIGSNTLVPGGPPATIGGQVVSAGPSGINVGGTTNIPLATPAPNTNSGSVGVLPLQPAGPGSGAVQNQQINLSPSQNIAAQIQQPVAPPPGSPQQAAQPAVAALPNGVAATAGGPAASVDGHAVSLAADGRSLVVDGSMTQAVTGAPSAVPGVGPALPLGNNAVQAVTTTGNNGIVTTGQVIQGSTLLPGGPGAVVDGHSLSAATDGGVVIDGQSTARPLGSALSNGAFSLTLAPTQGANSRPQLVPDQATSVIGNDGRPTSAQIVAGQTIQAGAPAATISGHQVSVAPNGALLVDSTPASANPAGMITLAPSGAAPQLVAASPTVITGANGQMTQAQVVAGRTVAAGSPPATISGHVVSVAPNGGLVVDNAPAATNQAGMVTLGPAAPPQLAAASPTVITGANGQTTQAQVIAGQTVAAGSPPATISGHVVSVAPNGGLVVDNAPAATNQAGLVTLGPAALPQVLPATSRIVTGSNGQPTTQQIVGSQTLSPGQTAQVSGHAVSVAPNGQLFVDNAPTSALAGSLTLAQSTPPDIISAKPTLITGPDGKMTSADVIAGSTLTPGATASISGHVFSIAPNGQIVADGASTLAPNAAGQITVSNNGILAGQQTITTGVDGKTTLQDVIGGRTLKAGGPAETISGHMVSLASNGAIVVDGTQSLKPSGAPITAKPLAATFSLGGVPGSVTASSTVVTGKDGKTTSADIVAGQTLLAGGPKATVSGHTLSLQSNGDLVIDGSSTVAAAAASATSPFTFSLSGGKGPITAKPSSTVLPDGSVVSMEVVDGQMLTAGGMPATVSGHVLSLDSAGQLVVDGTSTVTPSKTSGSVDALATGTATGQSRPSGGAIASGAAATIGDAGGRVEVESRSLRLGVVVGLVVMVLG